MIDHLIFIQRTHTPYVELSKRINIQYLYKKINVNTVTLGRIQIILFLLKSYQKKNTFPVKVVFTF